MSHTWDNGFHERDTAYYAAVGFLCHQWNVVESLFYGLPCDIMGVGRQFHALLFRHLGIQTVETFLADYAEFHLTDAETVLHIKHVIAFVEVCRINRNIIIHGFPTNDPYTAEPIIRTGEDKNRKRPRTFPRSIEIVRQCCDDCETAGGLIIQLQFLLFPKTLADMFRENFERRGGPGAWNARLHSRPPLPKSLEERAPPNPPKRPSARPPSRA